MAVMNGIYITLHSASEQRQLQSDPCQIQLVERSEHQSYLEHTEDIFQKRARSEEISRGERSGLKYRVHQYDNPENPTRCPFKTSTNSSSLQRMCSTTSNHWGVSLLIPGWTSDTPIGQNTLELTVAKLCPATGIEEFCTNHSLRGTAATRQYQKKLMNSSLWKQDIEV